MLRKGLVWMVALMMLCAVAAADGGILPSIPSPRILPPLQETTAISYGEEMGVQPAEMGVLEDGRWYETYSDVTTGQYNTFSERLGQQGYAVASSSVTGFLVSAVLVRDAVSIDFSYDFAVGTLTMIYPVHVRTAFTTVSGQTGDTLSSVIRTGDQVSFGSYPQSSYYPEPILWTVLQVRGDSAILISKYVLDARIYGPTGDWRNSSMRSWLNNDFLPSAFTSTEQMALLQDAQSDRVTVPTKDEALAMNTVAAEPTMYARANGVLPKTGTNASYITRTASGSSYVYYIGPDATANRMAVDTICGVRPVISVSFDRINVVAGYGTVSDPWIFRAQ